MKKFEENDPEQLKEFLLKLQYLYDDFRICNADEVLFTVIPKCSHSGKAEIWGRNDSGVFECLKQAETFSKLFS